LNNKLDLLPLLGSSWYNVQNNKNDENNLKHLSHAHCATGTLLKVYFLHSKAVSAAKHPDERGNFSSLILQMKKLRLIKSLLVIYE
jgi:hypothetical protein